MYGGRNDEDGSFSKVDCYDIGKGVGLIYHVESVGCGKHLKMTVAMVMGRRLGSVAQNTRECFC